MAQIYILGARLMSLKKNKTYFNVIFGIIIQLGLQTACWSDQVERGIILFQAKPDLKDTISLADLNNPVLSESTESSDNVQLTICTPVL